MRNYVTSAEMPDDVIVTMKHVRSIGMCSREPRAWMAKNGFNWTDFLNNGIPASRLIATGDALVERVVEAARNDPDARRLTDGE